MSRFVRCIPWLLGALVAPAGCGGDDAAGDAAVDGLADTDRLDAADDAGPEDVVDDGAEPEDGFGADLGLDADEPDETNTGETADTVDGVPPGDVSGEADGEACDPATVGWDVPVVLSPAELQALLAAGDRILINVFDGDIPQIPGTDAHLPYTDVAASEAYLARDLCADLVLYCRRGVRSGEVAATLVGHGYRFVRVLEGGIEAWQAAGYPVE
jgi:rhodanese-related sulfurtransferase